MSDITTTCSTEKQEQQLPSAQLQPNETHIDTEYNDSKTELNTVISENTQMSERAMLFLKKQEERTKQAAKKEIIDKQDTKSSTTDEAVIAEQCGASSLIPGEIMTAEAKVKPDDSEDELATGVECDYCPCNSSCSDDSSSEEEGSYSTKEEEGNITVDNSTHWPTTKAVETIATLETTETLAPMCDKVKDVSSTCVTQANDQTTALQHNVNTTLANEASAAMASTSSMTDKLQELEMSQEQVLYPHSTYTPEYRQFMQSMSERIQGSSDDELSTYFNGMLDATNILPLTQHHRIANARVVCWNLKPELIRTEFNLLYNEEHLTRLKQESLLKLQQQMRDAQTKITDELKKRDDQFIMQRTEAINDEINAILNNYHRYRQLQIQTLKTDLKEHRRLMSKIDEIEAGISSLENEALTLINIFFRSHGNSEIVTLLSDMLKRLKDRSKVYNT